MTVITNFSESMPVKEFKKSAENLLSYQYELGVPLFGTRCIYCLEIVYGKLFMNTSSSYVVICKLKRFICSVI